MVSGATYRIIVDNITVEVGKSVGMCCISISICLQIDITIAIHITGSIAVGFYVGYISNVIIAVNYGFVNGFIVFSDKLTEGIVNIKKASLPEGRLAEVFRLVRLFYESIPI